MKWTVHPAKRDLTKTILSIIFIAAFLIIVGFFYGVFWTVFGFIVLFVSLHSYFFPTAYEITEDEVIKRNVLMTQKRKLSEFRRVYEGKNGVLLSPFRRKTFLNQFRGVFLLLPVQKDGIVEFLKLRVEGSKKETNEAGGEK